jgi:hypothetical protein
MVALVPLTRALVTVTGAPGVIPSVVKLLCSGASPATSLAAMAVHSRAV